MSFLGPGGNSHHHRSKSPARSVISTRPTGENVFVRDKSPSRPHTHRSKSEPEGFFGRRRSRSRSRSRSRTPTGISGLIGVGRSASRRHRSRSPGGMSGFFGGGGGNNHHSQSRSRARSPGGFGFFGGGDGNARSPQSDIRSFFGGGKHYSSTSRYGRRPREGLVQKIMTMIRRTWRDLKRYAKNNPIKMVTLVLMPLLTSGLLVKLLGSLGIKLPNSIASLVGGGGGGGNRGGPQGSGYYGSQGYGGPGGHEGGGGGAGGIGLKEVLGVAKMFM